MPEPMHESVKLYYSQALGILYINTWVAPWKSDFFGNNEHANFIILDDDFHEYLPQVNFSKFDLIKCNQYLDRIGNKKLILICNGAQQSTQSSVGGMSVVIDQLSKANPVYEFLITYKVDVDNGNITYTDDLFGGGVGNLNQITFISKYAGLIIGKNSGPFTYCHTRENLSDPNKTFFCFSHIQQEMLTGAGDYGANILFSNQVTDERIVKLISDVI
jgi:hypothetical protein